MPVGFFNFGKLCVQIRLFLRVRARLESRPGSCATASGLPVPSANEAVSFDKRIAVAHDRARTMPAKCRGIRYARHRERRLIGEREGVRRILCQRLTAADLVS